MKIGFTYDLRDDYLKEGYSEEATAEFDRESTITAIAETLSALGHQVERIGNVKALVAALANKKRWDLVFNICEGLHGKYSRESQVPAILEAYDIPCTFSDSLTMAISLKKDLAKLIMKAHGILTPEYAVIEKITDLEKIKLPFPLFVKPLAEGTSKGVDSKSKVTDSNQLQSICGYLLKQFNQPVLVETFCSGREFTVGMIGTGKNSRYLGALEVVLRGNAESNAYSYQNKEYCEKFVDYLLVKEDELNSKFEKISLEIWRLLGCRDAGRIDFIMDSQNNLNFIEINPLAGLHPEHSDLPILNSKLGLSYESLLNAIIQSVAERITNNE